MTPMNYSKELLTFRDEFQSEIQQLVSEKGEAANQAFLELALNKLSIADELEDPITCYIDLYGRQNRHIQIDGYCFNDSEHSISIFISNYAPIGDDQEMNDKAIQVLLNRMKNFIISCYEDSFKDYCDVLEDSARIASDIGRRLRQANYDDDIDRINFYVITNRFFTKKTKKQKIDQLYGKNTSVVIWGLERFFALESSGKEREPILIDFINQYHVPNGLQCIQANISGTNEYAAYLCIIPGETLAQLYSDYGSELLEQNVRAYLGEKNTYNKGIIRTIKEEPEKFFIYNNGIAVTGHNVKFSSNGSGFFITSIEDMQIINGGQTTASLYSQYRTNKELLDGIFVPMKLTILKKEDSYEEVVDNISRYSNSQSKVSESDFFSSHPFNVKFEVISKKVFAPACEGELNDTHWYYERARGKYNQTMARMTAAEKTKYQKTFPKKQVIKKDDLSKYYMTSILRPYDVAKGKAKCTRAFASIIKDIYDHDENHSKINEEFFKLCICHAILFMETDKMVAKEPWYKTGGYKNVIVPYAIAKTIKDCPTGFTLDYKEIWSKQTVPSSIKNAIEINAEKANDFFAHSPNNMIPTEYAKKKEAWEKYSEYKTNYPESFYNALINTESIQEDLDKGKAAQKETDEIQKQNEIFRLGQDYWTEMLRQGYAHHLLTSKEANLLKKASTFSAGKSYLSSAEINVIWKTKEKLKKEGIIVKEPEN